MTQQSKGTFLSLPKIFGTFLSFFVVIEEYDIKKIREDRGLTQQAFADLLGITRELLGQMERGQKGVSKATKILVKNFLEKDKNVPHETLTRQEKPEMSVMSLAESVRTLTVTNNILVEMLKMAMAKKLPDEQG